MRTFRGRSPIYRAFVWLLMVACTVGFSPTIWRVPAAGAAVALDHAPIGTKVIGTDIEFVVKAPGSVDSVTLLLRKLDVMEDFTRVELTRSGSAGEFRYTLPLSQEPVRSRVEYFFEAYSGGQQVAVTSSYYIRFIERPFVGEPEVVTTAKLSKDEWKILLRGGKRPAWQKWWVWAIAGVVVAGAVAATAGGDSSSPPLSATAEATFVNERGTEMTLGTKAGQVLTGELRGGFLGAAVSATFRATAAGGKAPYTITIQPDSVVVPGTTYSCAALKKDEVCSQSHVYSLAAAGDFRDYSVRYTVRDAAGKEVELTLTASLRFGF